MPKLTVCKVSKIINIVIISMCLTDKTNIAVLLITLLFFGGCSVPLVKWPTDYQLQQSKSLGFYIQPCGDKEIEQVYSSAAYLELLTKGYDVKNINLTQNEKERQTCLKVNHAALLDTLIKSNSLSNVQAVIIMNIKKDSVLILEDLNKLPTHRRINHKIFVKIVPVFNIQYIAYEVATKTIIYSGAATDTCYLYSREQGSTIREYPWMTAARQLSKAFKGIPICSNKDIALATHRYPIEIYVDKSYRDQFSNEWQQRLKMRILFVNDIFKDQFDTEFEITNFYEWDNSFDQSLDKTMDDFRRLNFKNSKAIQLGITLNSQLKITWLNRDHIGVAEFLGDKAVITAQPSFPALSDWNSIEETLTLVHEFGHIFGASHSSDRTSVMYSTSGNLSCLFDSVNKEIVNSTVNDFFEAYGRKRAYNYIQAITNLRKTDLRNNIEVLAPCWSTITKNYFNYILPDSNKLKIDLNNITSDSVLQLGLRGLFAYRVGDWERAIQLLKSAVKSQQDFSEAHWYLYKMLSKRGMQKEAEEQLVFYQQYGIPKINEKQYPF